MTRVLDTKTFVVLGEVNALLAEGKEILSFCIGQPDFATPVNICSRATTCGSSTAVPMHSSACTSARR